jgi:hypothetical protein
MKKLAEKIGFKKIEEIPLDPKRVELGKKIMIEKYPEALRERIKFSLDEPGALYLEK